jgi:signal peptidase I
LIVDELTYYFHKPARGDIIVFHYPLDPSLFFIKRIIGLPGDTVAVNNGSIYVQTSAGKVERLLNEPYINTVNPKQETSTTTLGVDEYFVLGDNRNASFDSRIWGPVPGRYIVGRAAVRIFPFPGISIFPGAHSFVVH